MDTSKKELLILALPQAIIRAFNKEANARQMTLAQLFEEKVCCTPSSKMPEKKPPAKNKKLTVSYRTADYPVKRNLLFKYVQETCAVPLDPHLTLDDLLKRVERHASIIRALLTTQDTQKAICEKLGATRSTVSRIHTILHSFI